MSLYLATWLTQVSYQTSNSNSYIHAEIVVFMSHNEILAFAGHCLLIMLAVLATVVLLLMSCDGDAQGEYYNTSMCSLIPRLSVFSFHIMIACLQLKQGKNIWSPKLMASITSILCGCLKFLWLE